MMTMQSRKQLRLTGFDYSRPGYYFVTICTKGHIRWFGRICDNRMMLNARGRVAWQHGMNIPNHFTMVTLDEFVVMPDHVHGILIIGQSDVGNAYMRSLPGMCNPADADPSKMLLARIIQQYKSAVSRKIHQSGWPNFQWQKSYYDRIIRSDAELEKIRLYIRNNPLCRDGE